MNNNNKYDQQQRKIIVQQYPRYEIKVTDDARQQQLLSIFIKHVAKFDEWLKKNEHADNDEISRLNKFVRSLMNNKNSGKYDHIQKEDIHNSAIIIYKLREAYASRKSNFLRQKKWTDTMVQSSKETFESLEQTHEKMKEKGEYDELRAFIEQYILSMRDQKKGPSSCDCCEDELAVKEKRIEELEKEIQTKDKEIENLKRKLSSRPAVLTEESAAEQVDLLKKRRAHLLRHSYESFSRDNNDDDDNNKEDKRGQMKTNANTKIKARLEEIGEQLESKKAQNEEMRVREEKLKRELRKFEDLEKKLESVHENNAALVRENNALKQRLATNTKAAAAPQEKKTDSEQQNNDVSGELLYKKKLHEKKKIIERLTAIEKQKNQFIDELIRDLQFYTKNYNKCLLHVKREKKEKK